MIQALKLPAFLTDEQIEAFRSQARAKREAAFLAPQLIEHIAVLYKAFHDAIESIEAIREAAGEVALTYEALASGEGPEYREARHRAALARLYSLIGDDGSGATLGSGERRTPNWTVG